MAGLAPKDGAEVERLIGQLARGFILLAQQVARFQQYSDATDFTKLPVPIADVDQAVLKSAIGSMSAAVKNADLTFIQQASGPF